MKRSVRERRQRLLLLLALVVVPLTLVACGGGDGAEEPEGAGATETGAPAAEEEPLETVRLRVLGFLPENNPITQATIPRWTEIVEEVAGDAFDIEFVGGPESIPTEEQFDAVVQGVVDIGFNVPTFYLSQVPAGNTMHVSPFTPDEERENGYFEFLDRVHQDAGVGYLGRWISALPFFVWTNKRIETLDDLRGLRMRSTTTYQHIFDALGAKAVNIVPPEVFSALERGLVDGFAFPLVGPRAAGWLEVTKFVVDAPFFNQNGALIVNPSKWDSLSDEHKRLLEEATKQFESELAETMRDLNRQEWDALESVGVEVIQLPADEADRFTTLWYDETWKALVAVWNAEQEDIDEAKQLLNFDEFAGDVDKIHRIPCAPLGEAGLEEPFCLPGE